MSARKFKWRTFLDPNQREFGIIWELTRYPFRLRAGDVIRIDERLARVIRVNESAAVVVMERPVRQFTTRFDQPVRFKPSPARFRISPNSEVSILNRKAK